MRLETGETIRLDLQLAVGEVAETVSVSADAPMTRATASLGQVISSEKVTALPLNGRSFVTLAGLAPGVALPPGLAAAAHQRRPAATNKYLFDGISVLQPEPGRSRSFRSSTPSRSSRSRPTARPPSSAGSTAASSTSPPGGRRRVQARFRVHAARGAQRSQLFGSAGDGPVPAPPVRWSDWRPDREESHVLLRRLSGTASGSRPAAISTVPGAQCQRHLHRGRLRGGCRRSSIPPRPYFGGSTRNNLRATRFRRSGWIPVALACSSATRCRPRRHGEQLPAHRQRKRRSGSVGRPGGPLVSRRATRFSAVFPSFAATSFP